MNLSSKLNEKVNNISSMIENFSKKFNTSVKSLGDFTEIASQGDEKVEELNKSTEEVIKKFNKAKTFCKNFAEDAKEISEEVDKAAARLESEIPADASDEDKTKVEKFSRKFRILSKRFAEIAKAMGDITTEAQAIVDMKPEDVIKNKVDTQTAVTSTDNGEGAPAEGAETTTQPSEVQTEGKSVVKFSMSNYLNFAVKSIKSSFAEVKDKAEDAKDIVKDVSDSMTQEPEIKPAQGNEPAPTTVEAPAETVAAAPKEDKPNGEETPKEEVKNMTEEQIAKEAEDIESFGQEAILKNDKAASEELDKKLSELEEKAPGKGEEVMTKLENFSAHYDIFKKFCGDNATNIFDKIKDFSASACDCAIKKNIDADDLGSKAEELEKNQPGAGELLTSVIECFGKIIDAVKVPAAPDAPIKPKFCAKNFCGDIEKFVSDIKVEDKRFCRDVKSMAFALQNAIEDEDSESIKKNACELATKLDSSEDETIKSFGEKLVKFAEELAASESAGSEEKPKDEGVAAPEQIEKADQELNKVIDKLGEKGEQLKPEIKTFAKKLCSAYKSMKCFTEEDLTKKLEAVEGLKKDFDENQKPAETPAPAPKKQESILVEEVQRSPAELPSDSSLQNFSQTVVSMENDPLGHLASLDIR